MPIIKSKDKPNKEQLRITVEHITLQKIKQYCEWADVKKLDDFFEQASEHILSIDKEWLNHIKSKQSV